MMQKKIESYFRQKEADLVSAVSRLVRIDSTKGTPALGKPFGPGPALALEEALQLSRELGLPGENLDGYVGVVDLNQEDTALHILAHLDVVTAGPGWTVTSPFVPLYQDGLLYGRGASDNKGPLVAALFAMKAVKELGLPLGRNVRLILGTDEESGFADINWYYARHPYAPHSFAPDAAFPLTNIEKGHFKAAIRANWGGEAALPRVVSLSGGPQINVVPPKAEATMLGMTVNEAASLSRTVEIALGVTFTLTEERNALHILSSGKGTHASTPEEGNNALTALLTLLSKLPLADCASTKAIQGLNRLFPHNDHYGKALGIAQSDELSGPLTQTLTMIDLHETGLIAHMDCRTPLCATEETCMKAAVLAAQREQLLLEGHLRPAHHTPAESPFVKTLLRCYEQYTGDVGVCLATGGGTYVHDIPGGVAFGATMPGFDSHLHGPDERVCVADLLTASKIFTQAILTLCS